jgi:hypothetical protein
VRGQPELCAQIPNRTGRATQDAVKQSFEVIANLRGIQSPMGKSIGVASEGQTNVIDHRCSQKASEWPKSGATWVPRRAHFDGIRRDKT